jgi:hypothetical protein
MPYVFLGYIYLIMAEMDKGKALPAGDGRSSSATRMISRSVPRQNRIVAGEGS